MPEDILIMYSKLSNGTYTKTQETNKEIVSTYIDLQEYASALASLILRHHPPSIIDKTPKDTIM